MSLYTDTSSSIGWGAYWSGRYIQARWSSVEERKSIVWKGHSSSEHVGALLGSEKSPFPL